MRVIRVRLIEQGLLKDEQRMSSAPRHAARNPQAKVVSMPVPPATTTTGPTLVVVAQDSSSPETTSAATNDDATSSERLSVNQLLAVSGIEPELLNKILALGLVAPVSREGVGTSTPTTWRSSSRRRRCFATAPTCACSGRCVAWWNARSEFSTASPRTFVLVEHTGRSDGGQVGRRP